MEQLPLCCDVLKKGDRRTSEQENTSLTPSLSACASLEIYFHSGVIYASYNTGMLGDIGYVYSLAKGPTFLFLLYLHS